MRRKIFSFLAGIAIVSGGVNWANAQATDPAQADAKRRLDLADQLAGTYQGDVISDARGSSQSDVTITVTRTGKNQIQVSSDYPRIPTVTIPLTKAMSAIVSNSTGYTVFVDTAKDPARLDLTIDDASWSGRKISAP